MSDNDSGGAKEKVMVRSWMWTVGAALLAGAGLAAAQEEPEAAPEAPAEEAARPEQADDTAPASPADAAAGTAEQPLDVVTLPDPAAEAPADTVTLDDVVVTAQKREQRLVEVPINVSTLDRGDIQKVRLEQVRDVMGYIPNMDIKEQVPGAIPVVTIRGVGLDDFSSTNSPSAGIYVDQITLSSLALMSFDLFDMERLEVLKGPQGTLYGRNSNAGAINLITAAPTTNREAYMRAGYGSYKAQDLEGMYNMPLGDTVAFRVAAKYIKQDEGYWNSRLSATEPYNGPPSSDYTAAAPVVRDIGRRDIQTGRVRLAWDPFAELGVDFKVEMIRQRSEMGQPEFFGTMCAPGSQPVDPDNCTDLNSYTDTDRDPYLGDWRGEFPYNIDQLSETLLADYDFGWAMLSSVTGHIAFERFFHIDVDGNPGDEFNFLQGDTVDQVSQELRLAGVIEPGNWLAGVYYAQDNATVNTPGRHDDLLNVPLRSQILADQDTTGYAVFANMDWKLGWFGWKFLEPFSVTTGLRYGYEERQYEGSSTWLIAGQPCQPAPVGCVPGANPGDPPQIDDTYENSSIQDSSVSWKAGLNYAPTSAWLIYANASEGTKSGGYFSGVTTNDRQLDPYPPEELRAYEVGVKRAGLIALNASYFWYDYENLQTFMREGSAPVQFVGSIPEAQIAGLDFDTTLRVLDGLTVRAGLGLLKTELSAFTGPTGGSVPAGNRAANAPEMTWNALARYELPIFQTGLDFAIQADAHYSDEMYKEATNDPLIKSEPYTIINSRLSLLNAGRTWEFALWGRNLTEEFYVVQGVDVGALFIGNHNYNAPQTYGADFIWQFGPF
jgi:iron complex outermembrane recepter protein